MHIILIIGWKPLYHSALAWHSAKRAHDCGLTVGAYAVGTRAGHDRLGFESRYYDDKKSIDE